MGRPKRAADGGIVYHVLNRANGRLTIFRKEADYDAFERIIEEAVERFAMRLLAYVVMPNHWHLVVWPHNGGDLSRFTGWLTLTHTQRWHANRGTTGSGHVYQGRFKSFPVQDDGYFLAVCRYVERNPLRAGLVRQAESWRWSSLWRWHRGNADQQGLLAGWPTRRSASWVDHVNTPQNEAELTTIRRAIGRGNPFGDERWSQQMVDRLGLETTIRPRGRPRKSEKGS
jgi:REP-associated tyrosine transposase